MWQEAFGLTGISRKTGHGVYTPQIMDEPCPRIPAIQEHCPSEVAMLRGGELKKAASQRGSAEPLSAGHFWLLFSIYASGMLLAGIIFLVEKLRATWAQSRILLDA